MTQHPAPGRPPSRSPPASPKKSKSLNAHSAEPVDNPAGPSTSPKSPVKARPMGPRSPPAPNTDQIKSASLPLASAARERAGSSRTSVYTSQTVKTSILGQGIHTAPTAMDSADDAPHAPYRPPEAVVEPPEEHPPGYGVVEEHMDEDEPVSRPYGYDSGIDRWQAQVRSYSDNKMDVDEPLADRPTLGPGILPRKWLKMVHEHELFQPDIVELPQPQKKATVETAPELATVRSGHSFAPSLPDYDNICTQADVWEACPGGQAGRKEWYFCPTCWAWIRIVSGHGGLPLLDNVEEWQAVVQSLLEAGQEYPDIADVGHIADIVRTRRLPEQVRLNDLKTARQAGQVAHFHQFDTLLHPGRETRIERITSEHPGLNAFPHLELGQVNEYTFDSKVHKRRLFVSCSSDWWIVADAGTMPGQIPVGLVKAFTEEKINNPSAGITSAQSVSEAYNMLILLLGNALFKGQRGWVNLNNSRFQRNLGMSEAISVMLYHIGFACRQEPDCLRVGPYSKGESITESDVRQMDRYMMRVWMEMQIYIVQYRERLGITSSAPDSITLRTLEESLPEMKHYPKMLNGYSTISSCDALGVTKQDTADTIEKAYDMQVLCDPSHTSAYLSALQVISNQPVAGKESLQMKLVMERSMGKYSMDDVQEAYAKIGYDDAYADVICVPAAFAPDSHILDLHKKAMQAAANQSERTDISAALTLIGRERDSDELRRMGESGQTVMSVDDAYAALSAPRDAVDDGLIMQYEMAVNEYPGKMEHYRTCLSIIADAAGEERPGIRKFLEHGSDIAPAPRLDIPVGLQNIGNTCYLNSILQYLYSIKPLREAVMRFDSDAVPRKADVERSRRFVRQLQILFLQLYRSESSSVRPEEELAYLAITRPEFDAVVTVAIPTLDSIPDMPSPSSTMVATPSRPPSPKFSPEPESIPLPVSSSPATTPTDSRSSILGKRQSEDRDSFSDSTPALTARHKSESDEFDNQAGSPSATTDLGDLTLRTPADDELSDSTYAFLSEETKASTEETKLYSPPPVPPPLPARPVARRASTLATGLNFGLQHDSAEVLINVLTQLELAFDPDAAEGEEPGHNLISELFSCKYRQQLLYRQEDGQLHGEAPVESVFVHPIIGVEEEGKDLYDCLGELYLQGSEIELSGKKGYMFDLMESFPPMLYIQMRRAQIDYITNTHRKTNTHIAFGQTLAMDRFLASGDSAKREKSIELTRQMSDTRARLHHLRDHKPLSIPATFTHVREALQQIQEVPELDLTPDFLDALARESEAAKAEIEAAQVRLVQTKQQLDDLWRDEKEMEYELVAVFMHRGKTSNAGHYWTYQAHLPDHRDKFFKYNDETVTEVPAFEVLQDRTGTDANPALLCYVRKGQSLIDTLHREILDRPPAPPAGIDGSGMDNDDEPAETITLT